MFQSGDIVEHSSGRWKGRRLQVVTSESNGYILVRAKTGFHNLLKTDDLKVIRFPVITDWIRVLHRARAEDKLVLRRAFDLRRRLKQEIVRTSSGYNEVEKFLWTFFNLSAPTQ